jgi:NADPH:quinone reductase-like Zn-dependent oxidoreductase
VKPVIYRTFPLAEAAEAHRLMESSQHIGKIVLTL